MNELKVQDISRQIEQMREFSSSLSLDMRIEALKRLKTAIKNNEANILKAIKADFNKPEFDSYITEVGLCYNEINYFLKHLRKLAKPRKRRVSISNFPAKGRIIPEPYGVVLIIAPWNFPFQLAIVPLIGAIAAGNSVILKPASATRNTADIIQKIISEAFKPEHVSVFRGSRQESDILMAQRYDYIFFTGSPSAARHIAQAAAVHLTPVTLELGGKSPCIIDSDANIEIAARRIGWAKFFNGGQVCVAPDYLLVHESVHDSFVSALIKEIQLRYYSGGVLNDNFPLLVNESKGEEMQEILNNSKVIFGGKVEGRKLEPTVIAADFDSPIMQSEVFAPVAPIIKFSNFEDISRYITEHEKPLALYYYGKKNKAAAMKISFGGGCINDCIMHVAEESLPFGGVGNSGMGNYHADASFNTFSHLKSVLVKGKAEMKLRYDKSEKNLKFIKKIIK